MGAVGGQKTAPYCGEGQGEGEGELFCLVVFLLLLLSLLPLGCSPLLALARLDLGKDRQQLVLD